MPIPWAHPSTFPAPLRAAEMVGLWRNLWFQGWGRKIQDELGISFSLRKSSGKKQTKTKQKNDGNLSEKIRSQPGRVPLCRAGDGFIIKIDKESMQLIPALGEIAPGESWVWGQHGLHGKTVPQKKAQTWSVSTWWISGWAEFWLMNEWTHRK